MKNKFFSKFCTRYFIFGYMIMLIFVSWSVFPKIFAPYEPKQMFEPWSTPSLEHLLGTNDMGYDIFSELIFATSTTLITGIIAAAISLVVGTVIGTIAGYLEGWKGEFANGFVNVFLLIPMLPMTIILAAYLGPGTKNVIIAISLLGWCSTARAIRAKTRQVKTSAFVESLVILGMSKPRIIFKHIIPNVWEVIWAKYILSVANCMLTEASVSFMGLGDTSHVTWGGMINFAFKRGGFSRGFINWYLPPGICIVLCVMSFYFISRWVKLHREKIDEVTSYLD